MSTAVAARMPHQLPDTGAPDLVIPNDSSKVHPMVESDIGGMATFSQPTNGGLTADNVLAPQGPLNLTDDQRQLVEATKEAIAQEGIDAEEIDDWTVMRYLVARTMRPDKAAAMYAAHRQWRGEFVPDGPTVPEASLPAMLASDHFCLQTAPGHMSWLVIRPRFHDAATRDLDEFVRFIVYTMDKSLGSLPADYHKFGVIIDMEGLAYRNLDSRGLIAVIQVLQNQYPERLVRLFVLHVPYLFWSLWKLVSPFIDPYTKKKFCFVEDKLIKETLLSAVHPKMLPSHYGGEGEFVPIRDVNVETWPSQIV